MLRILLIDESQKRTADVCAGLVMAGHQVAAVLPSSLDLNEQIKSIRPDVILIETDSPSRDTLEHLAVMDREMPRPVVIFAQEGDSSTIKKAIQVGVSAYVVDGLEPSRLKPVIDVAMARFEEHQSLKQALATTTRKLSERKVVERAKGVLMKMRGIDEEAAYTALRDLAMQRGKTIAQVAQNLLDAASLML
jgi:two-component system, response regulator / RNA-binding antiterminator